MEVLYTIKAFEEDYAICEATDKREVNIPFEDIPSDSVVGTLLRFVDGEYKKAN